MKKVIKNKSYMLLFTGSLVSEIGTSLYQFALALYILKLTGNEIHMALFMAIAIAVRVVLSPVAGVLVDRWNKIRVIYVTDFIRGLLFFVLFYLYYSEIVFQNELLFIYLITALASVNAAFFTPASMSSVPDIVGEENLQAANGVQSLVHSIQSIVGIVLGAVIYDFFSIEYVILINAVSFFMSGVSEMFIKAKFKKEVEVDYDKRIMDDYKESLRYMRKTSGLMQLVMYFLVINFAITPIFSVGVPSLFKEVLVRENTLEMSYTNIAFNVSMIISGLTIGGLAIKNFHKTITSAVRTLLFAFVYATLLFYLVTEGVIGYWVFYGLYIIGSLLFGFAIIFVNVPVNVVLTRSIEPEYRGRVFSTVGAMTQAATPFAMIIGGVVLQYSTIWLLGIVCCLIMYVAVRGFVNNDKIEILTSQFNQNDEVKTEPVFE